MATAMTLIGSQTLTSQAFVVFANVPQTYRDLYLVIATPSTQNTGSGVKFNADTDYTNNYSRVCITGNGSSASSFSNSGAANPIGNHDLGALRPNGLLTAHIMDYSATDKHKTILSRAGNAGNDVWAVTMRWASTTAITSITLSDDQGAGAGLLAGNVISLYGIAG